MALIVRLIHLLCFLDLTEMVNDQVIDLDDRIVDDLRNCIICQKSDDVKDFSISLQINWLLIFVNSEMKMGWMIQ